MNHVFRTVYNCTLGVWQVASELVTARGGGNTGSACAGRRSGVSATLRPLSFGLWLALGWVGLAAPALAEAEPVGMAQVQGRILADPKAPGGQRPTVIFAPNGVPLVNITTPSEAGVSRNLYSQFDVGSDGAILNNSRSDTQTQLGGWVQGNPWLATGTAKVILNEVNSADPSRLHGYIEVAGARAEVVIANPAGIQVNGGGFINTPRVTLTTGRPVLSGGALDHYRVERGAIRVEGAGVDTSRVDYTNIIARALEVHGGIWANELRATLGTNRVSADHQQVTATAESAASGDAYAAQPELALDVGALGGMYANKIWLVGNEQGLGARNAGDIGAQAGGLVVTVDGRLENTGALQSTGDAQVSATGGLANAGTLSAARELSLSTGADIDNRGGTLNARRLDLSADALRNRDGTIEQTGTQELAIDTGSLSNRDGGRIGLSQPLSGDGGGAEGGNNGTPADDSPVPEDGADAGNGDGDGSTSPPPSAAPLAGGVIDIAGILDNDGGQIVAGGAVDLNISSGFDNSGGQLGARRLALQGGDLHNRDGNLIVSDAARIEAAGVDNDGGVLTFRDTLTFAAGEFSNRGGNLVHNDADDLALQITGTLDNRDGTLETRAGTLTIDSHTLVNEQGRITHAGSAGFELRADTFSGAAGTITTAGEAQVNVGNADHRGGTLSASRITLDADNFDNRGGTLVGSGEQDNTITVAGTLDNGTHNARGGSIASNGDLQIQAGTLGNAGGSIQHAGTGSLQIAADSLAGAGGTIASNGDLTLTGNTIDLSGGSTSAERIAIVSADLATSDGNLVATGEEALQLDIAGTLNNDRGTLATNGALDLSAGELSNREGSLQVAGTGHSQIEVGGSFDNTEGRFITAGDVDIDAATLLNTAGSLQAAGESSLRLAVAGRLDNSLAGQIGAGDTLQVTATTLVNTAGQIEHAGDGNLQIDAVTLEGPGGSIASNGSLLVTGDRVDLSGATTSAERITIDAGDLTNAEGSLVASSAEALQLSVTGSMNNDRGTLATNGAFELGIGELSNREGNLQAAGTGASRVQVSGSFDNSGGSLIAGGDTDITARSLINSGGSLQAAGESSLQLTVEELLDNSLAGLIGAGGELRLSATTLDNSAGRIEHAGRGSLRIDVASVEGAGGTIASNGTLAVTGDSVDVSGGTTSAERITIGAGELTTAQGSLIATGEDALQLQVSGNLNNNGGTIAGNGAFDFSIGELSNREGTLQAAGFDPSQLLISGNFDNSDGSLITDSDTSIVAGNLINTGGSLQTAGASGLRLTVEDLLDNSFAGLIATGGELQLVAATFNNSAGTVNAGDAVDIATQELDNDGGTLVGNGALILGADSLSNRQQGVIASLENSVELDIAGLTDNRGGTIQAALDLTLASFGLDNAGGKILGGTLNGNTTIDTRGQNLENNGGTIASASGTLDIRSGALGNDGGLLQSAGNLHLDTAGQALVNTNAGDSGGLVSGGSLVLATGALDNRAGLVHAGGDLIARSDVLDNRSGGQFGGSGNVDLQGTELRNNGGVLHSGGDLGVLLTGTADNDAGLISAGSGLSITAAIVDTRNTQGETPLGPLGLQGDSIDLSAGRIENRNGLVAADTRIEITGSQLDNTRGEISSAGTLGLTVDVVSNTLGTLFSGTSQTITADSLSGDGRILSQGELTLTLKRDFTNTGEVTANGRAEINTDGLLINESTIQAGELLLRATDIDNTAGGEISGGFTQLSASESVTNRGLIDGAQTRIDTDTLDNIGSGRIYGDHIAIQAETITNREESLGGETRSAVIAARQRLDIATGSLINREESLIFSAGAGAEALNIGGQLDENGHATGRAGFVHNASATIESLGGLTIDTTRLLNSNEHFASAEIQVAGPTDIVLIQPKGYQDKYTQSELFALGWTYTNWKGVGAYYDPSGKRVEDWTQYEVTRTEYETQVTESAPAVIRSGGDMTLRGGELVNDKSQILAGGALIIDQDSLDNIDAEGEYRINEIGTSRATWVKLTGWDDDHKRKWGQESVYAPGDQVTSFDLGLARAEENLSGAGDGYSIVDRNTDTAASGSGRDSADASTDSREIEAVVAGLHETDGPQSEWRPEIDTTDGASVGEGQTAGAATGPQSSAGITTQRADGSVPTEIRTVGADTAIPQSSLFRVQPESGDYLIETDPRFASYRGWLSSDYLLDALDYDQDLVHKRLGDGFYEQTLIREQVAQLTGRRFLGDYSSDEDQYRALLEAGATYAEAWDLRPGVALTAEQMAQLTSDIVWLVEETVTLPDGSTTTALVPQVYVRARPGDLDGNGTLISGESVQFDLAQDLTNTGTIAGRSAVKITGQNLRNLGGRITGDQVSLHARKDLDNIGGTIDAESGLAVSAGRDISIAATTQSDSNRAGLSDFSRTNIDRIAGLYVSKGNLVATAGRDFTLQAAEIVNSGDGATQVSAGRDLGLETVETQYQENTVGGDNYHLKQGHTEEVGSSVRGGGQLLLSSGGDTSLRGAEVSAGGDIGLVSGGDLLIESATNTRNYDYYHKQEASSSLSSEKTTATQHYTEEVVGSSITAGGGVAMVAEGDIAILGSQVDAEDDIVLDGRDITIAASEQRQSHYHASSKSGPLGSEGAGQASAQLQLAAAELKSAAGDISLDAARNITIAASNLETVTGNINLTAVDDLLIAAGEVLETSSSWSEDSGYFTGGDFYASEQRAGTTETTGAQGSNISAGNNLNIDSGRATVIGSDLGAGNNLNIETDIGDIEILAARETSRTTYGEEETRVSFGDVASSLSNPDELVKSEDGQLKIKLADAEYRAVDSESTEVSHRGSNLTAGNDLSLDAIGDLTVEGSNLIADTDDSGAGDIALAGENVVIREARDSLQTSSEETSGSAELNVVVQHQAVEVAKAAKALDEAADNLKQAKEDYRKYEKDLKNLKGTLKQLEADYQNGAPGVSQEDIVELKQIIDDAEGDKEWYQAGIVAAAAEVTSKTTALTQQTAAAAQSSGTYGFNAGVQLDVDATRTGSESQQTSSLASNLSGQNITINTGNEDGTSDGSTQIRGSHLQADNQIAIDTGELAIEASRDTASQRTQTDHGQFSVQQTFYGAGGGPTVSGSMDRSQARDRQTTYNNSTLSADQIALNSSGDTTLAGANVHAGSQLDVAVGGDLTVESQQNRASGSNNSAGISGGFGTSGGDDSGLTSVNGGANSANGSYQSKETVLTSLTSGGAADIDVGEHTQITGALVATVDEEGNDLGNLELSTETLDYADLSNTDYTSQQNAGASTSVGFTGSNPADPAQQNAQDATGDDLRLNTSNVQYSNESQYSKDKTLATVGQGNITVRDEDSEENGDLAGLNRDVKSTEKELFEVERQEGNIDVTVDHRILQEGLIDTIAGDLETIEAGIQQWAETPLGQTLRAGYTALLEAFNNGTIDDAELLAQVKAMARTIEERERWYREQTGTIEEESTPPMPGDSEGNTYDYAEITLEGPPQSDDVESQDVPESQETIPTQGEVLAEIAIPAFDAVLQDLGGNGLVSDEIAAGFGNLIETAYANHPEATEAALGALQSVQEAGAEVLFALDDATGNVVISNWNSLSEENQARLSGMAAIIPVARARTPDLDAPEKPTSNDGDWGGSSGDGSDIGSDGKGGVETYSGSNPGVEPGAADAEAGDLLARNDGDRFDLDYHENHIPPGSRNGGHLLERHVGLSDAELIARSNGTGGQRIPLGGSSSFSSKQAAEHYVNQTLNRNEAEINSWLQSNPGSKPKAFDSIFVQPTGRYVPAKSSTASNVNGVRVVVQADSTSPNGYRIITGHPIDE
ncbi:two-partner secretion domain-containing protein [Microbulbifer sp. M83]|uniref:two-partner secretion domain-containing protein n=1 Tax=Microbulbifer sp. M83 TaxID=3118246 RepID=UPI002FDF2BFD